MKYVPANYPVVIKLIKKELIVYIVDFHIIKGHVFETDRPEVNEEYFKILNGLIRDAYKELNYVLMGMGYLNKKSRGQQVPTIIDVVLPRTKSPDHEYIKTSEAAKILGVSEMTIRRWESSGELRSVRTKGGHRSFLKIDVLRMRLSL